MSSQEKHQRTVWSNLTESKQHAKVTIAKGTVKGMVQKKTRSRDWDANEKWHWTRHVDHNRHSDVQVPLIVVHLLHCRPPEDSGTPCCPSLCPRDWGAASIPFRDHSSLSPNIPSEEKASGLLTFNILNLFGLHCDQYFIVFKRKHRHTFYKLCTT